ncbi:MAG: glycosyltransferase family 8 protein [Eubacterium sp.]|nr:glycosyltransferase family 8 protein [Eubacterium sp.]
MNVIYACDDRFARVLTVSISSLCKYNKDLHILVIDAGITTENKKIISTAVEKEKARLDYVPAKNIETFFPVHLNMDRGSMAQFARLFISDILPEEWNRVLYLDCDTLIRSSLEELFQTDMEEMAVAGVEDAFSKLHWRALGLDKEDVYINSGVMLIDLCKWRELRVEQRISELIIEHKGKILQGDQGIINMVLQGKISRLPIRYNMVSYCFDFTYEEMAFYRQPYSFYSKKEVEEAKDDPVIVHFTSSFASMRPWQNNKTGHMYGKEWLDCYERHGFSVQNTYKKSYLIYKYMPHILLLCIVRILHSYIKPALYLNG